mmetsp:Transcript_11461/g.39245  ORF Transcript_11461/g.39245 Transcript_11461/m.39245 type:complete len:331 (-) Transcript_11461:4441-5433(-)
MLLPEQLLVLAQLLLLLFELIYPAPQPLQARVGEDDGVGEVGRQLILDQTLDLMHLESNDDSDLVQLLLLESLELLDLLLCLPQGRVDDFLLLHQPVQVFLELIRPFLVLCQHLFLIQTLFSELTHLFEERGVAPWRTELLLLLLFLLLIEVRHVVLVLVLVLSLFIVLFTLVGLLLHPLDFLLEDLQQGLMELVRVGDELGKLHHHLLGVQLLDLVLLGSDLVVAFFDLRRDVRLLLPLPVEFGDQSVVSLLELLEQLQLLQQHQHPQVHHLDVRLQLEPLPPQVADRLVVGLHRLLNLLYHLLLLVLQLHFADVSFYLLELGHLVLVD